MITPEIKEFVKKQTEGGISREIITAQLTSNGWSPADVIEAFESLTQTEQTPPRVKTGGFFFLFSALILFLAGLGILAWVLMR